MAGAPLGVEAVIVEEVAERDRDDVEGAQAGRQLVLLYAGVRAVEQLVEPLVAELAIDVAEGLVG